MIKNKIIYHYTSLEGLLGIIESKSIWSTNIIYLNDTSELNYAKKMFKEEIKSFRKATSNFHKCKNIDDSLGAIFYEILEENINNLLPAGPLSFYVSSFSEKKDLLSQWRGYCQGGNGFSVGFSLNSLKACVERASINLRPCIYSKDQQIKFLKDLIDKTSNVFIRKIGKSTNKAEAWDSKAKEIAVDFMEEFIQIAPTFKHPQFSEEKEWRIIAGFQTDKIKKIIRFRPGNSMLIPYIEIPLPVKDDKLAIDQIVVGPTNERLLSKDSVEMLLKSKNVSCGSICCSTIPYRPT